jgi:hypothetical protein
LLPAIWRFTAGFILFCVTLNLSVTAFVVSLKYDTQTVTYSETEEMQITGPMRDLLALVGSSGETKVCVSGWAGPKGCVVGKTWTCGFDGDFCHRVTPTLCPNVTSCGEMVNQPFKDRD